LKEKQAASNRGRFFVCFVAQMRQQLLPLLWPELQQLLPLLWPELPQQLLQLCRIIAAAIAA